MAGPLPRQNRPDWPQGEVPEGRYAGGARSPIVWVLLCAGCAGFAPFTSEDYDGYLSGHCGGCGRWSRELHRFPAYINSVEGCSCGRHGEPIVGDMRAVDPETYRGRVEPMR